MRQLVQSIENLLSCYDCVVVPGIGGFLMNVVDAHFDPVSRTSTPRFRQVSFNARLTFNDGLLAQWYQKEQGLTFREASECIRHAVAEIRSHLSDGESILLGNIGHLRQADDGRLLFEPLPGNLLDADACGLEPVTGNIAVLSGVACDISRKGDPPAIPVVPGRTSAWKWAAAVAACLLLAVLFPSAPLLQEKQMEFHHASVLSPCTISQYIGRSLPEDREQPAMENAGFSTPEETAQTILPSKEETASIPSVSKHYVIVIASFPTRESAEKYMATKNLSSVFPEAGIAASDGRYRVYAEAYESRTEAVSRLSSFRARDEKYAKAWVTLR